jgi:glycosyltransferase involved in cell wall biosynthesis
VPNAIDTAAIAKLAGLQATSRAVWGIPADAFVIGGVGRLELIKGFDLLIEAFALLPKHAYLVVVGDGSQRQVLAQQAERLGVAERCIITGFRRDVAGFYRLFDCFAIVSHSEGLSMALLEAMVLGCPVVTTNVTLEHDVITNQHTGLIVTSRVPAVYAGVLVSLMQDALLQKRLGQEAMAMVHARYDVARVVAAIESLYHSVKNSI